MKVIFVHLVAAFKILFVLCDSLLRSSTNVHVQYLF